MNAFRSFALISCLFIAAACSDDPEDNDAGGGGQADATAPRDAAPDGGVINDDATVQPDAAADAGVSDDDAGGEADATTSPDAAIDRGPTDLLLDFDPNGIFWDEFEKALYVTDETNHAIKRWREGGTIELFATLPPPPPNQGGLGQIARLPDGRFVVPQFGFGQAGAILIVAADGTSTSTIPNLDPARRRTGVDVGPDGTIYAVYFTRANMSAPRLGAVTTVSLDGVETAVVSNLLKPVSVIARRMELIVTEQDANRLVRIPLASSSTVSFAEVDMPDLLGRGEGRELYSGSRTGAVYHYAEDGTVTPFAINMQQPRGVAFDREGGRVFVADHDGEAGDGTTHYLRIRPRD